MNRMECISKSPTEHRFGMNKNIRTTAYGDCITNEPLQATKLKKCRFLSLNKITAFSYTHKRIVCIPKGTIFCLI